MKTPGMVFATWLGDGGVQNVRTFAPMAEVRGFRNFAVISERLINAAVVVSSPQERIKQIEAFEQAGAT